MPRTITVTYQDGSQRVYQNAPDDITPDQVAERAKRDGGKPIASIDGGRRASAPVAAQPRPTPAPAPAPRAAQAPKPAPQPAVVDNGGNWFTSAIKRGAGRTLSGLSELVSDVPAIVSQTLSSPTFRNLNPFASALTSYAVRETAPAYREASAPLVQATRQRGQQIAQAAGPRQTQAVTDIALPTSIRQVPGYLGQVGASAAETVSESALPILAAAGTGVVTRSPQAAMIVSGATSAPMTYGSIRDTQRETGTAAGGEARAAVATVASTLLDSMFGSSKFASTLTQQAAPMGVRAIVREAAKQAGEESITEMAQTAIERAGGGKDLVSRDAMKDYIESGVVGAFGGGAISGGVNTARAAPSAIRAVPGALRSGLQQSADLINRIALPTRGTPEDPLPQDAVQVDPLDQVVAPPATTPDPAQPTGPQAGSPGAPQVAVSSPAAPGVPTAGIAPTAAIAVGGEPPVMPGVAQQGEPQGAETVITMPPPIPAGPAQAAPAQAEPVEPAQPIVPPIAVGKAVKARIPSTMQKVDTQFELHDLSNMRFAEGQLQNRDRTRAQTQEFLKNFINTFDPEALGQDNSTDRGAPIINKDNVILSGNGRIMGLEQIYAAHPELAEAYKQFLRSEGYDVEGIDRPVLVRRLTSDVDERQFVVGSNDDDKAALSAPEQARQDATDILTPEVMAQFAGGDILLARNDAFITAFLSKLSAKQRGDAMDKNGKVSTSTIRRINNALLHRAYGGSGDTSSSFMSKVMERTDDDSKTLTGALMEAAPDWIKFQQAIDEGSVDPKYDITSKLLETIAMVSDIKARDLSVAGYLRMEDMVSPMDPFVKDMLLAFHNDKITRFKSKKDIAELLAAYADRAADQQAGEDMLGLAPTPSAQEVWNAVDNELRNQGAENQAQLVGLEDRGQPTPAKSGREAAMFDMVEEPYTAPSVERADVKIANDIGELLPEWERHLDEALKKADAIRASGNVPLFHATSGRRQANNPNGMDMTFYAEDLMDAARYAGAGGGRRTVGNVGRIEVKSVSPSANILDITTDEGVKVLAELPAEGRMSGPIILQARKDVKTGENIYASNQLWTTTKRVTGSDAEGIKRNIVARLREQGYDGIRFMDDRHPTVALFDVGEAEKPITTRELQAVAEEVGAEAPAQARQPAAAEEIALEDRSGISGDPKGNYTTKFREASFTNRTSIYEGAIRAMGYEPDKFRLFVPERQAKILSDALKRLTGIEVELDNGLNLRLAIDQLLDAHQTLQGMAYVLGISPRALSLDGSLKLKLLKKGGFLGVFYPDQNAIGLPGRSNSFAHEWSHALDYYLMKAFEADGRGLSGAVRQGQGKLIDPQNVRDAFVNLMNAMFFDKAEMAAKILALETKIAKSKSEKRKAELQAQIDRLKDGSSQMRSGRTKFYENAKEFDGGSREYWQSPTEMMARAFEAYVGMMTQMEGFGSEFIGKGNDGYLSNLEERFAKTFPKDEERNRIFEAFGDLMFQLQKELLLKPSDGVRPDMGDIAKMTDFDRHVEMVENGSLMARELKAFQRDKKILYPDMSNRAKDPKSAVQVAADITANAFFSMAGQLKMLERRYGSKAIKAIHDKLTYGYGSGEYTGRNFAEAVEQSRNKNLNRIGNILKANDLMDLDEAGLRQLRDALISESTANIPDNIIKGAAAIRRVLDAEFMRNTNAGIKLGYARGVGYLKRIIDLPLVMDNPDGFVADAGKVYENVFDRDIGDSPEEILEREGSLKKFMFLAKKNEIEGLEQLKKVNRQISKLENQQKTSDDPDQILAKLEQLYDERLELVGEMFDDVRAAYGKERAEAWLGKMLQAADYDFDAHSPDNSYTKNRELPPEADKLLERFYVQNPLEAVTIYIEQSARRVAYAERFGPNGEIRDQLIKQMASEGVSSEDQQEVLDILNIATGRVRSRVPRSIQRGLAFINAAGIVTMLPRAVLSSLSEAVTAGLSASSATQGIRAFAVTLAGTKSLNGKQRAELARAIGIVTDVAADMTMEARMGGRFGGVTRWDLLVQRMFENTGLTALTRAQRTHSLAAAHAFLDNLAQKAIDGDLNAIAMLNELGISDPKVFSDELLAKGRMPTVEELDTAWGDEYALASQRFINMTVQNPTPMDRPKLANNPVGRIIYGITGFSTSFWRKVIKRHAIMTAKIYQRTGAWDAGKHVVAGFLPAALTLFVLQATVSTLREWLLNRERWNDLKKKGELEDTMAKLAFTRTFAFGMADPFIQAYTGLKYQRDLSNVLVGAVPGLFLQNTQAILNMSVRDSAKTNTAEYNATRAAYTIGVAPAVSLGLSMAPGGQIARAGYGAGQMLFTSPQAGNAFATAIQGPKGSKTDPETGEVIGPPPKKKEK